VPRQLLTAVASALLLQAAGACAPARVQTPAADPAVAAVASNADAEFMRNMILHHAQALDMVALVPARTTRSDVRLLAERMAVSQRDEIALMRGWLESRGEPAPALDDPHRHHTQTGNPSHGMLSAREMGWLESASGGEFDRLFLELMIRHHEGALVMVAELLASPGAAQRTDVFRIAAEVDADQRAEIERMHAMLSALAIAPPASAHTADTARTDDPRVGLRGGFYDAATALHNLTHVAFRQRPPQFIHPDSLLHDDYGNTDMAFRGNYLFVGSYHGFQIWDILLPAQPTLRTAFVCPGGQGDLSVHGNLLFMSVQETRARLDCGTQGVPGTVSTERFRGVRIFDISNLDAPRQVAAVQTCRGSHTHTLVTDPRDSTVVYVYNSGTNPPRPEAELAGCVEDTIGADPAAARFRIEIIRVPLSAPHEARIINMPRIFADTAGGTIAGLWPGGTHGPGRQETTITDRCHDITAYPEIGLAAGACSGNGILLDIRDPVNPVRVHEVIDPNFAYWHSATFSNDGRKVVFTDEWGGGTAPRCRREDRREWGANALFTVADQRLTHQGYYKLPAVQADYENCVAHNGSLIPIPGRDVMVQAWYQGGISVFDFTDPANPIEIAYFDRGPVNADTATVAGHWSAYWYNGRIYGSEILRGLDVLRLVPGPNLSPNEIVAAESVRSDQFNPQLQTRFTWEPSFFVVRAYLDQLMRNPRISYPWAASVTGDLVRAERASGAQQRTLVRRLAVRLDREASRQADPGRVRAMAAALRELAEVK
jgi:uncharacterized protein (DUF305 family)